MDAMEETAAAGSSSSVTASRKPKGRGAAGDSATTMTDSRSQYDSVAMKKGFGPAKCESLPHSHTALAVLQKKCSRLRPFSVQHLTRNASRL